MNRSCGIPTERPAKRPCASMMLALRSFDWLMIADEAQRPRWVATSKQIVSKAPRRIPALTGSICARVGRGGRRAARRRLVSYDTAAPSGSSGAGDRAREPALTAVDVADPTEGGPGIVGLAHASQGLRE